VAFEMEWSWGSRCSRLHRSRRKARGCGSCLRWSYWCSQLLPWSIGR